MHAEVARLPSPPPLVPPATARRTAPPRRRWRSSPGVRPCHRTTPAPGRAWTCWACGARRSSPSCCRPGAASAPPPAPAVARAPCPLVLVLVAAPLLTTTPAPPAIARRTAPPLRRWRSCPGTPPCHRGSPAPGRAWTCRAGSTRQSSRSCSRPQAGPASRPAPAAAPPRSSSAAALQPSLPTPAPQAIAPRTAPPLRQLRSCPGSPACHCASPAPCRAWAGRAC
eukprot:scaffold133403_cov64-Phaeocystis_antarctica.AAC.3